MMKTIGQYQLLNVGLLHLNKTQALNATKNHIG